MGKFDIKHGCLVVYPSVVRPILEIGSKRFCFIAVLIYRLGVDTHRSLISDKPIEGIWNTLVVMLCGTYSLALDCVVAFTEEKKFDNMFVSSFPKQCSAKRQ